ncbi:hypothetical protein BKA70DRAFT_1219908 [Coprinopsis sp. MPI-PUGE-AT-0042]|nr:hypothetical protein BKA70DRAFT_1219908 [Coprinopsis sp. MPI-PUGE-AT-0042]
MLNKSLISFALLGFLLAPFVAAGEVVNESSSLPEGTLQPDVAFGALGQVPALDSRSPSRIEGLIEVKRQVTCSNPSYGICPNAPARCCPLGGDCCTGGGCCGSGNWCYAGFFDDIAHLTPSLLLEAAKWLRQSRLLPYQLWLLLKRKMLPARRWLLRERKSVPLGIQAAPCLQRMAVIQMLAIPLS